VAQEPVPNTAEDQIKAKIRAIQAQLNKAAKQADPAAKPFNPLPAMQPQKEVELTESQRKMRAFMADLESQDAANQRTHIPRPMTYEEIVGDEPDYNRGFVMGQSGRGFKGKKKGGRGVVRPRAGKKLSNTNKGFELLKKMGWKEGTGIGVKRDGRVNPVQAKARTRFKV